jgi:hypothetical protein
MGERDTRRRLGASTSTSCFRAGVLRCCRDAGSWKGPSPLLPQPEGEQGLREAVRDRRSVSLCGYGASDGEAVGP